MGHINRIKRYVVSFIKYRFSYVDNEDSTKAFNNTVDLNDELCKIYTKLLLLEVECKYELEKKNEKKNVAIASDKLFIKSINMKLNVIRKDIKNCLIEKKKLKSKIKQFSKKL